MDRREGRCREVASAVGQTVELHWADRSIESKVTLDYLQALLRKYIHSRIQDEASGVLACGYGLGVEKQMAFNM